MRPITDLLPAAPADSTAPEDESAALWFELTKPLMSTASNRGLAHLGAFVNYADHVQELALHKAHKPARMRQQPRLIRGRAFAGEATVTDVDYRIDDGPWQAATITSAGGPGMWARWQFRWDPQADDHTIRVRASDDRGNVQPDFTPWNELGYMHKSVLAHPVHVGDPVDDPLRS